MKLPSVAQYPRSLLIGGEVYKVKFLKKLDADERLGDCDDETRIIRICTQQTKQEIFYTFVHECLHAMEFEYKIKIKHKAVHRYEQAIGDFLLQNF